jgi:hypothetical protein
LAKLTDAIFQAARFAIEATRFAVGEHVTTMKLGNVATQLHQADFEATALATIVIAIGIPLGAPIAPRRGRGCKRCCEDGCGN